MTRHRYTTPGTRLTWSDVAEWVSAAHRTDRRRVSSRTDLQCAAQLRPDLLSAYIALEDEIGHTLRPDGTSLRDKLKRLDAA